MTIMLSKNKAHVDKIQKKLDENLKKYGKRYCPCVMSSLYESENASDYVCMCKQFKQQIDNEEEGLCHCGLYVLSK